MQEQEGKDRPIHPFFSPHPVLPKCRDIPWIGFVLGSSFGAYMLLPADDFGVSPRVALILGCLGCLVTLAGAFVIHWIICKIFPPD